jgi:hypothetical protein
MKRSSVVGLTLRVCLLIAFVCPYVTSAQTVAIYASPNGDQVGNGQSSSSPVDLNRARALVRSYPQKSCIVWLANGTYRQVSFDSTDTRSSSAPVTYQAVTPHGVTFQPENSLDRQQFTAIPDSIKARIIDPTAKGKVKQLSLSGLGLADTAQWHLSFPIANLRSPKFYKDGLPLPMSRYPEDTTMIMGDVVEKGKYKSRPGGKFKYGDDRVLSWLKAINDGGLYLSGNWQFTWRMDVVRTLSVNTKEKVITQAVGLEDGIGTKDPNRLKAGTEPYYALNLVEEIKAEGQWSINFKTRMLYMWVPASGTIMLDGDSKKPAISLSKVNNTSFIGIDVRGGSGDGIGLNKCNNVLIAGSHITYCSGYGVRITGGSNCTVQSNDINLVGAGGVIITSSSLTNDQSAVKPSGHKVINNHIYNYATESVVYSAAVDVSSAVGTYVAYNKVHDCPHVGIMHGGNNNVLEYNEVFDVVKKYTDMGAFYKFQNTSSGWNARGNKLYHNYIHDAPRANGIYEDDCASGDSCNYNIIANVVMATYNHNGYFNSFVNTIYFGNTYPATSMTESSSTAAYTAKYATLQKLWSGSSAYKTAYPECQDMVGSGGRNDKYDSRIWPSITGSVFITSSGALSNVSELKLFNKDGTTNAGFAKTGEPFTRDNVVFKNNRKLLNKLLKPIAPFQIDSLRSAGVFAMTGDSNWHINRIGLHKDSFRTDISSTKTAGIDPVLSLALAGKQNFKAPDTIRLTGGLKIPNAANVLSSMKVMDKGKDVTKDLVISKHVVSYDSVRYAIEFRKPAGGGHQLTMRGIDGLYWEYLSNTVAFTIEGAPAPKDSVKAEEPKTEPAPQPKDSVKVVTPAPPVAAPAPGDSIKAEMPVPGLPVPTPGDSVVVPAPGDSVVVPAPQDSVAVPAPPKDSVAAPTPAPAPTDSVATPSPGPRSPLAPPSTLFGDPKLPQATENGIDMKNRKLVLYPNPANNVLNISYWNTQVPGNVKTMIYDNSGKALTGKVIFAQTGVNQTSFTVSSLASGIYVFMIENPDHTIISQRFVVQH